MKKINILFLSLILFAQVSAQEGKSTGDTKGLLQTGPESGSVTVKKCKDFTVTGDGNSVAWNTTDWIDLVLRDKDLAGYGTRAKVLYSESGIYFLFYCGDEKLTTTMKDDNLNLWEEDVVEVFLWTSEDFPVYFEYEISPMDFELPIIVPNNKGRFLGWLPWNYAGDKRVIHATNAVGGEKKSGAGVNAWIAEFFIPYKLLNPLPEVPPVSGTLWRANMYRIDYDKGAAHFSWQKTLRSFHEYKSFGTFVFE
jgi:hypothetical protein